jgi:Protein of unknown function (DUF2934)
MQEREIGSDAARQESATTAATSPTENEIARVAHRLWLEKGCPHGSDQEDWFEAEALLKKALAKCEDLPRRPSAPTFDTRSQLEMLDEFATEVWQEGHWEVWEREWGGARWVPDVRASGVGFSIQSRRTGEAA